MPSGIWLNTFVTFVVQLLQSIPHGVDTVHEYNCYSFRYFGQRNGNNLRFNLEWMNRIIIIKSEIILFPYCIHYFFIQFSLSEEHMFWSSFKLYCH